MDCRIARNGHRQERGSALLAVMGCVAILSAVGFASSAAARNGLDRVSARGDSIRAYYLARGGIEAAVHEMSVAFARKRPQIAGESRRRYELESGSAEIVSVPAGGLLDVNRASADALQALLSALAVPAPEARTLSARIIQYRAGLRQGLWLQFAPAAGTDSGRGPLSSFGRRRASIQMTEELLSVGGITADLLYGGFVPLRVRPGGSPALRRVGGLMRFLRSGGPASVDLNSAPREILLAAGLGPALADRVIAARSRSALVPGDPLFESAVRAGRRIALGAASGSSQWMLTATGRLSGRRAVRSVTAIVATDRRSGTVEIHQWYERPL